MGMFNTGRDFIAQKVIGGTGQIFDATHAYVCVGDSSAAFAATQTDLQAATNKFRKIVDEGYPTCIGNLLAFKSTFTSAEANFDWREWGISNGAAAGSGVVMLNRLVENNGTKVAGQTWVFEGDLTIAIGS
jgi:hypothetical protein